jgi:hypothetical protein
MFNNAKMRHQWVRKDIEGITVDAATNALNDKLVCFYLGLYFNLFCHYISL